MELNNLIFTLCGWQVGASYCHMDISVGLLEFSHSTAPDSQNEWSKRAKLKLWCLLWLSSWNHILPFPHYASNYTDQLCSEGKAIQGQRYGVVITEVYIGGYCRRPAWSLGQKIPLRIPQDRGACGQSVSCKESGRTERLTLSQ